MTDEKFIETVSLFPELNSRLIELLRELSPEDWNHPTNFPNWTVKDIAVHLLDTSIRRLSSQRDCYQAEIHTRITNYSELVHYITSLADRWVESFGTVSPEIIIEMIDKYQTELYEFLKSLDPFEKAYFSVLWAGEENSLHWFDIAREYTERWIHQMQIRDVLKKPPLYNYHLYYPLLDTFMQAIPYHLKTIKEPDGYLVCIQIDGEPGAQWFVERKSDDWHLHYQSGKAPDTKVTIKTDAAWKIFTRWEDKSRLADSVHIEGDAALGNHVLDMVCVMM